MNNMGSVLEFTSSKHAVVKKKQRSKGERLGWKSCNEVIRKPLSEMSLGGGRVSGNYCVMSCAKLIP